MINLVRLFSMIFLLQSVALAATPGLINRSDNPKFNNAFVVSIDLCPSHRAYEKSLFVALEKLGRKIGRPVPVAIALSGQWILRHPGELKSIRQAYLDITWVNHSYTHPVEDDFCNNPKVDFNQEVKANIALFKRLGLKPSVYFRFPGLRYNPERLKELTAMGYIALGADAWLAKGEKIKGGSIVLVHGNGNEPQGVRALIDYLKLHETDLIQGKLRISPLKCYPTY